MQKIKAIILLLCMFVYMADVVALPVSTRGKTCGKMMCCGGKMKAEHKESPGKNCDDGSGCFSCPLCYTATVAPLLSVTRVWRLYQQQYTSFASTHITGYCSKAWKPPNAV